MARSLSPVWDETVSFELELSDLLSSPMEIQVFDEDHFSSDDLLGTYTLSLEPFIGLAWMEVGLGVPHMMRLPLTGQGELFITATVNELRVPSWGSLAQSVARWLIPAFIRRQLNEFPQSLSGVCRRYLKPMVSITKWPTLLREVKRTNAEVRLNVTMVAGWGLLASDIGGTSDPYARVTLGTRVHLTRVIKKELNPKWNERFSFTAKLKQMVTRPLTIEVFDEDLLKADDSLGAASLDVASLVETLTDASERPPDAWAAGRSTDHVGADSGIYRLNIDPRRGVSSAQSSTSSSVHPLGVDRVPSTSLLTREFDLPLSTQGQVRCWSPLTPAGSC